MNPDIIHLLFASILIVFFGMVIDDWIKSWRFKKCVKTKALDFLDNIELQLLQYRSDNPENIIKRKSLLYERSDLLNLLESLK